MGEAAPPQDHIVTLAVMAGITLVVLMGFLALYYVDRRRKTDQKNRYRRYRIETVMRALELELDRHLAGISPQFRREIGVFVFWKEPSLFKAEEGRIIVSVSSPEDKTRDMQEHVRCVVKNVVRDQPAYCLVEIIPEIRHEEEEEQHHVVEPA